MSQIRFLVVVGFAVLSVPAGGFGAITAADSDRPTGAEVHFLVDVTQSLSIILECR